MLPILANGLSFSVHGNLGGFTVTHDVTVLEPGLEVLNLRFRAGVPEAAPRVAVCWKLPIRDVQARWTTDADRQLWANWWHGLRSKVTSQAPVFGLYNSAGENRLTFAASDALNNLELKAGVSEETGEFDCEVKLFDGPTAPIAAYDLQVRLDLRPLLFHLVLKQVAADYRTVNDRKHTILLGNNLAGRLVYDLLPEYAEFINACLLFDANLPKDAIAINSDVNYYLDICDEGDNYNSYHSLFMSLRENGIAHEYRVRQGTTSHDSFLTGLNESAGFMKIHLQN